MISVAVQEFEFLILWCSDSSCHFAYKYAPCFACGHVDHFDFQSRSSALKFDVGLWCFSFGCMFFNFTCGSFKWHHHPFFRSQAKHSLKGWSWQADERPGVCHLKRGAASYELKMWSVHLIWTQIVTCHAWFDLQCWRHFACARDFIMDRKLCHFW